MILMPCGYITIVQVEETLISFLLTLYASDIRGSRNTIPCIYVFNFRICWVYYYDVFHMDIHTSDTSVANVLEV